MKRMLKIVAFFCVLLMLFSVIPLDFTAQAASVYVRPKKTVYLVMDDSGSMDGQSENDANYALQTFLAVLDKDEEVNIYFLNKKRKLKDINIADKSNEMLAKVRVNYPEANGSTPFDTVTDAAEDLKKAVAKDSDREYWLVVITDGGFSGGNPQNYIEKFSGTPLKNGDYPNFLYVGIGGGQAFSVPSGAENRFFLEASNDIIKAMNEAVVHITNRQILKASNVDSNTIAVDLPYPARNIVVLAQTYDTKINSYNASSSLDISENYRVEYPVKNPSLQYTSVGYVTEAQGSSIKSGHIELTYDKNIKADKIIVMVEPAIGINAVYIGEGGLEIDPKDMQVGEEVTVQMTVCDSETNAPLDSTSVFGDVTQYITVNGTRYDGNNVKFKVPEKDLEIDLVAEFSDGFVLDINDKYTDLKAKREISMFVSNGGYFEADIKDLKNTSGIVVTPLLNGSNFTAEDLRSSSLYVKGGGFFTNRFDIEKDEANGTFVIHPRAGFLKIFTPTDEVSFEIEFSDGQGKVLKDTISVKITGDRPILPFILGIIGLLIIAYIIWVEVTRKRFPKGSYVKYYNVNNDGAPDANLSDRIFLNRPSLEKLVNGSYLPIPYAKYKVKGDFGCTDITFVANSKYLVNIEGVVDTEYTDEYGFFNKTTSYVPINSEGDMLTVQAPIDDDTKTTSFLLPIGYYLRKANFERCIRMSTKKFDEENGQINF